MGDGIVGAKHRRFVGAMRYWDEGVQVGLTLTPEEMRALGYRVIDLLVEHQVALPEKPVTRHETADILRQMLHEPLPRKGVNGVGLLEQLDREVMQQIMHLDHPRFFAFVPSPSNFISILGDALASGFNVFAGTWLEGSGPAQIELTTIDWLRTACGLLKNAGGLFVSGGSMANITALAVARHIKLNDQIDGAVIYASDQTHSSIERGLWLLGFQRSQLRKLATDATFRLDPDELQQAIAADRVAGLRPFCVIANAGTTNTGAIDPLPVLADLCQREQLWLHADGAYGAATVFCERGQQLLNGLGQVDSLSLDPHKWLFQPYEIGCVLIREAAWLQQSFHILPEYLEDAKASVDEVNFCDMGIQLTRGFRALKLWLSFKYFGADAFAAAIEHGFALAELAETLWQAQPDWEVVTAAQMGVLNVRYLPPNRTEAQINAVNRALVQAMMVDGLAMVSTTVLHGQTVIRFCTINPRTTIEDIRCTVDRLAQLAQELVDL